MSAGPKCVCMSIRPGRSVFPERSICLTSAPQRTVRASAIDVIRPPSSTKMAGFSTYRPVFTSSIRAAVITLADIAGEAKLMAAAAASNRRFIEISPIGIASDVNDPAECGEHAFVHHLAQCRVREDGLDEVRLDQLGGLADRIALDQLGNLCPDHVRA